MKLSAFAVPMALLAPLAHAQLGGSDAIVTTKDNAYYLLPPEVVSGGLVTDVRWSSDGAYVLVQRMLLAKPDVLLSGMLNQRLPEGTEFGKVEISVYSAASHRLSRLYTIPSSAGVTDCGWLHGAPVAILSLSKSTSTDSDWEVVTVDAAQSKATRLAYGKGALPAIFFSPASPVAVMAVTSEGATQYQAIGKDQQLSPAVTAIAAFPFVVFDALGNAYQKTIFRAPGTVRGQLQYQRLSFVEGRIQDTSGIKEVVEQPSTIDLKLDTRIQAVPSGLSKVTARTIALVPKEESGEPRLSATVTLDGRNASISPKGDAVLYVSQECAFIRMLLKVPRQVAVDALIAAQKDQAMNDSKQAALAAIMYSADSDGETYPEAGRFYEQVLPYVKNRNILDRFVYTFGGGRVSDIQKPAETEIGYVPGPGGRAVAYADGHVRWIPNS